MCCIVSDIKVEGKGKSKKDARQDAAKKMITELKSSFCNNNNKDKNECENFPKVNTECSVPLNNNDSLNLSSKECNNLVTKFDSQEVLKIKLSPFIVVSKLKNLLKLVKECHINVTKEKIAKIKEEFKILMESAHIDYHHMLFKTDHPVTYQLTIQLNTVPNILETSLGKSNEEVCLRTIEKILNSLNKMIY